MGQWSSLDTVLRSRLHILRFGVVDAIDSEDCLNGESFLSGLGFRRFMGVWGFEFGVPTLGFRRFSLQSLLHVCCVGDMLLSFMPQTLILYWHL